MASFEFLAVIISILGLSASITYYALQIRNQNETRKTQLLMEVQKTIDNPEWWDRYIKVVQIYTWKDYDDYEKNYGFETNPEKQKDIRSMISFFHGLGVLIATDRIDIDLLGMIIGGMIMPFWNKMEPIFIEESKRSNSPYAYVYLELLKDEIMKRKTFPRGKASYLANR